MQFLARFVIRRVCAFACGALLVLSGCGGGGGSTADFLPPVNVTPLGTLSLLAGGVGGAGTTDGVPGRFYWPTGLAADAAGNIYVADRLNQTIRKITSAGVATLAGMPGQRGFQDGQGAIATFNEPGALAVDNAGNVYVVDTLNSIIRKITAAGQVTTLAGSVGQRGFADGTGTAARLDRPSGIAVDAVGNLFVSDSGNNVIRKITSTGVVTTIAGNPSLGGFADAIGANAKFQFPTGVVVDTGGSVYVADQGNNVIRKITLTGSVTTVAGTTPGGFGNSGFADGPLGTATFGALLALTIDGQGNLLALDLNRIRKITPDGVVTTLAARNVDGTDAFFIPYGYEGIATDVTGNIYVTATYDNLIRKRAPDGVVSTVAGTPTSTGLVDGLGGAARFSLPGSVGLDLAGNIFVADLGNNAIRRITPAGAATTIATAVGATSAQGTSAIHLTIDQAGYFVVYDEISSLVRRLMPDGSLMTFAGSPRPVAPPEIRPPGTNMPPPIPYQYSSMVIGDGLGTFYIADFGRIRKVTLAGDDSFVACGTDNYCLTSPFNLSMRALARDTAGNFYTILVHAIVKITPTGTSSVVAGDATTYGFADGIGSAARFTNPAALVVDNTGNILVADTGNHTVRKVTPAGVVTTIAGKPGLIGVQTGTLPASLTAPTSIVVTPDGKTIYVTSENAVLKIQP